VLQGTKTDLAWSSGLLLPDKSNFRLRLGVSKYSLDTRSETNYDDRDELRYAIESSWSKLLFNTVRYELHSLVRLDHLVYVFKQRSADNRWTRFYLAGSTIRHQPNQGLGQALRFDVSANYQAYDFELDSRTTRSTVFRRFSAADSAGIVLVKALVLNLSAGFQVEEFGRLFWDSFAEERSDETRSYVFSGDFVYHVSPHARAGIGAMYDRRRGKRFPDPVQQETRIFQDIESYGPTFLFEQNMMKGFFLHGSGRALRQFQLNQSSQWIASGEITAGFRW
jgi:hypothetical protein